MDDFLKLPDGSTRYTEKSYLRTKTFPPKHKKPSMNYAGNMTT